MTDTRVARRYATALFEAAKANNAIEAVEQDLAKVVNAIHSDPRCVDFLAAPYVGREEKEKVVSAVFGDRVTALTMQLLCTMLEKGRETEIENVRNQYAALRRDHDGIVFATVTSAAPLDDDLREKLIAKLSASLGKKVESAYKVDPALIGGVRVAVGDYVLDGSARGSLNLLRERLRYDVLKQS